MPSVLYHILIARDVLRFAETSEPYRWLCTEKDAFIAGGWAPDLGVFPGTVPLITDAAHYIFSGRLGEAMWRHGSNDAERAFAAGWCLHVLADASLHPLINAAVGEAIHGDRERPCSWGDSPAWHQRIEIGLDGYEWVNQCGDESPKSVDPSIRAIAVRIISAAFNDTYPGCRFSEQEFSDTVLNGYRGIARLAQFTIVDGHRLHNRRLPISLWRAGIYPYGVIRLASAVLGQRFRFFPLGDTRCPSIWLRHAFSEEIKALIPRFFEALSSQFAGLRDVNLDTGKENSSSGFDEEYLGSIMAAKQLRERCWKGG